MKKLAIIFIIALLFSACNALIHIFYKTPSSEIGTVEFDETKKRLPFHSFSLIQQVIYSAAGKS
jgi:hypothetical protein